MDPDRSALPRRLAPLAVALCLPFATLAAVGDSSEPEPSRPAGSELARAKKAIQAKNWPEAVKLLEQAASGEPGNAEIHNLLGFAERNLGHLDAAFAHYEKALQLNPRHRGAHEYIGEAYLLAGKVAKAEEHLAELARLCDSSCEEYRDLQKAIAEYRRKHGAS
jgi:Flp pilus assembly protein TadD